MDNEGSLPPSDADQLHASRFGNVQGDERLLGKRTRGQDLAHAVKNGVRVASVLGQLEQNARLSASVDHGNASVGLLKRYGRAQVGNGHEGVVLLGLHQRELHLGMVSAKLTVKQQLAVGVPEFHVVAEHPHMRLGDLRKTHRDLQNREQAGNDLLGRGLGAILVMPHQHIRVHGRVAEQIAELDRVDAVHDGISPQDRRIRRRVGSDVKTYVKAGYPVLP